MDSRRLKQLEAPFVRGSYDGMLEEARAISQMALSRVYLLHQLFPRDLPHEDLEPMLPHDGGSTTDRRRQWRVESLPSRLLVCREDLPGEEVEALVVDVCLDGLGIWLPDAVPVGSRLTLGFPDAPHGSLQAEVRHCWADGAGWRVGCAIVGPFGD